MQHSSCFLLRAGPLILPRRVAGAKKDRSIEPLKRRALQHQTAKYSCPAQICRKQEIVAGLEQVVGLTKFEAVVEGYRAVVEPQEGQPEPTVISSPLSDFGVEASKCRTWCLCSCRRSLSILSLQRGNLPRVARSNLFVAVKDLQGHDVLLLQDVSRRRRSSLRNFVRNPLSYASQVPSMTM